MSALPFPSPPTATTGPRWPWARRAPQPLNLALQGGGAHGAFTWGVLDALLADERLCFEGLSGSSAGAMNAVVLAHGWLQGGRDGARTALATFWTQLGELWPWGMLTRGEGDETELIPGTRWLARWAGQFAPAQLNPLGLNPLRDLLVQQVDFERLRARSPFKLFIATTQVRTGRLRVFREHELSVDVLLASACLPRLHHTVTIEGEPYWDGGYAANPAVFPLFYDCTAADILLVLLAPLKREDTPQTVEDIEARTAEFAFNASFLREMRMFAQAIDYSSPRFLTLGRLERRLQRLRFHMIDSHALPSLQRTDTRVLAHGPFLAHLREQGRACAAAWLDQHAAAVGRRPTLDLRHWFA